MLFEIYLVPFPFNDKLAKKVRPALILTEPVGEFNEVVISFISSKKLSLSYSTDVYIDKEYQSCGLQKPSIIRLHKLITLPKTHLLEKIGILNSLYHSAVKQKMQHLFHF